MDLPKALHMLNASSDLSIFFNESPKKVVKRIRNGGEKKTHKEIRVGIWRSIDYLAGVRTTVNTEQVDGMSGEYVHFLME